MTFTPEPTAPVAGAADKAQNPVTSKFMISGACDASAVSGTPQDWLVHKQDFNGMYQRNNVWRDCDSRIGQTPTVSYNYVDARINVSVDRRILYNTTFSACNITVQKINWAASGGCSTTGQSTTASGWGENGKITTSGTGLILRPARKDAAGNILDVTGYCSESFNIEINNSPGFYICSAGYDTKSDVISDLGRIANECNNYCTEYDANLLELT